MINTILCLLPPLIITYGQTWGPVDDAAVDRHSNRCMEIYSPPRCLTHFLKKKTDTYVVICTDPTDKEKESVYVGK